MGFRLAMANLSSLKTVRFELSSRFILHVV